jgi:hypothetical protein
LRSNDLNHYGVGLFDFVRFQFIRFPISVYSTFALETLNFSLALAGSLEGVWGKGVPPFAIPHLYEL